MYNDKTGQAAIQIVASKNRLVLCGENVGPEWWRHSLPSPCVYKFDFHAEPASVGWRRVEKISCFNANEYDYESAIGRQKKVNKKIALQTSTNQTKVTVQVSNGKVGMYSKQNGDVFFVYVITFL